MDLQGLVGLIAGLVLVYLGITNNLSIPGAIKGFIDYPSMMITFGGTFAAMLISFPASSFKKIPAQIKITLKKSPYNPKKYIAQIVDLAKEARRKGLLSLEEKANQLSDNFFKQSVLLIVDAIIPDKVKNMLETELENLDERHAAGWQFYEKSSTYAPAFGMIGTLIGLINMLSGGLNANDPSGMSKLVDGMAVALITTFYGSMLANLVLVPIGNKLRMLHHQEMVCKEIVVQGVLAIQAGENPNQIEESLNSYLNEKQRSGDWAPNGKNAKESDNKKS